MQSSEGRASKRISPLSILFIILPGLIFYGILLPNILNLPFADDYEILSFVHGFRMSSGPSAKLLYVLTSQYNEYKLIFGHSIFSLQYLVFGHVNFAALCFLGDSSILCLALALWTMFLPQQENLARRMALFVPVSWLLFQLSYSETLNWAEPALQNLFVLAFSFTAFSLLARDNDRAFQGALLCLVLAIAASGNGFFAAIAGFLPLLRQKRLSRLLGWFSVTLGMALLYAWHYNVMASQSPGNSSIFSAIRHLKVMYVFSFLGAIGEIGAYLIPHSDRAVDSFAVGIALSCLLGVFAYRGRLSRDPAVNAAITFIFLTALGVAGIRSGFGAEESTASRYRIYSSLLLILVWYTVSEQWLQHSSKEVWKLWLFRVFCAFAIIFSISYDLGGFRYIQLRKTTMIEGMRLYEHPPEPASTEGPLFTDSGHVISFRPSFNLIARRLLMTAQTDGIYTPPPYE